MTIRISTFLLFIFFGLSADAGINPKHLKKMKDRVQLEGSRMDCQPAQAQYDLEINNVRARLLTGGDLWWNLQDGRYIVPKPAPGFPEVSAIFASGIWMGGIDPNGALKLAGVTYRQGNNTDYFSGPLDEEGQTNIDICNDWDRHFVVKGENIQIHRKNYQESINNGAPYSCDSIPDDVKYWPARGNPFFMEKYDFPLPDQNLADFWDENADGRYTPCDGDFPILDQRGCEFEKLIPDEIVFWIFNDNGGPHRLTLATAIQMEVQAQAFAYIAQDELNDMTFYRFDLINKASDDIRDCYFALWVDPDLGCPVDDFIGCDVERSMAYIYNEDDQDGNSGTSCLGGGVPTYGENIPILGIDLFRGPRGPKVFCGVDQDGQPILCDPAPGSGQLDTLVEVGMSSFTYQNNSSSNSPNATHDPVIDFEFYNILKGFWRDGTAVTFGNSGFDPASIDTVKYAFSDPPNDPNGWSMCTADLPFDDRRMVQATGPLLLQPGAKNELMFGVVFIPNANYPCPEINALQFADDMAQSLFDNCFEVLQKPDAPDMAGVELDRQLILLLSNDEFSSNNANLQYMEKDILAPPSAADPYYRFEGYKIFQLVDVDVTMQELDDIDQARLIRQVDLKNGVDEIFNWFPFQNPDPNSSDLIWVPERVVDGEDKGIRHSFDVRKDAFATGGQNLINGKEYHYTVVAYAYNNYMQYNPSDGIGQRTPYIESIRNVRTYTFSPRSLNNEEIPTTYGQEAAVTRIEGIGTSSNALDMADGEIESILDGTFDGEITYKAGYGPINPKVVNPIKIKNGDYRLEIVGEYNDSLDNLKEIRPGAIWELTDLNSGEVIASDKSIDEINEQIIPEKGFSVQVSQVGDPGEMFDESNGGIAQWYEYEEDNFPEWWDAIPAFTGVEVTFDGGNSEFLYSFVGTDSEDPENALAQIGDGFFNPMKTSKWEVASGESFLTPAWQINQGFPIFQNKLRLKELNNVDIFFTSDKSKWSKCMVVESAVDQYVEGGFSTRDGRVQFDLRSDNSIDENGNEINGTGMSYFPGYAIDVETGERLNIFFGENSAFNPENDMIASQTTGNTVNSGGIGADMIWNPTNELILGGNPTNQPIGSYTNFVGGQHYIYVTRQEYDGCESLANQLDIGGLLNKLEAVSFITWTAVPIPKEPLLSLTEGLIPNDLTLKLRVANPFNRELDIPDRKKSNLFEAVGGFPVYEFGFKDVETMVNTEEEINVLSEIIVSPNPYYDGSIYGSEHSGELVSIANLPIGSNVSVYTFNGTFVRGFSRESEFINSGETQELKWDLNDFNGVRIPAGMYIINVSVPSQGVQKSIKWVKI